MRTKRLLTFMGLLGVSLSFLTLLGCGNTSTSSNNFNKINSKQVLDNIEATYPKAFDFDSADERWIIDLKLLQPYDTHLKTSDKIQVDFYDKHIVTEEYYRYYVFGVVAYDYYLNFHRDFHYFYFQAN